MHESSPPASSEDVIDAVIGASRALVAVAARSLAGAADDVTLPQYRALVVLASRGPQRALDLAAALAVNPSTATRMCDRLVRKQLVRRTRRAGDRRAVLVAISPEGEQLVGEVTRRRRIEVRRILAKVPGPERAGLVVALRTFASAAGEVPEQDWSLGWDQ
ncbi:MAG TPA: MarR family winged helix-turn-helix transcriptional regulator [Mycobacteriales bacterium]|jgi:DNA-binding MarR family transcriptional regulator|nr:MarR family winged helix-turn-helix transcriptional regulator [Mycobacteriales bacterium]